MVGSKDPMIVAICGAKRCGKDTVASMLQHRMEPCRHLKIAQPLKDMCGIMFGWSPKHLEDDEKDQVDAKWGISPRDAMKFIGTEMMQYKIQELLPEIGRNFWIKQLINKINVGENIIISDLRFVHEFLMIKAHFPNAVIVKVMKQTAAAATTTDLHSSEVEWKDIVEDVLIDNHGSLEDLRAQVDQINVR